MRQDTRLERSGSSDVQGPGPSSHKTFSRLFRGVGEEARGLLSCTWERFPLHERL